MTSEAFLAFQQSLPRQGPGDRATQAFALRLLGAGRDQRICDAGCGTGADIAGLLDWAPGGSVLAIDTQPGFIEAAAKRHAGDPRVTARVMDMGTLTGPFDLIWCAGALYFLGLEQGLGLFHAALAPEGAVVFSHPAFFTDTPSEAARAFWDGEETEIHGSAALLDIVRAAGFDVLDATALPDAAWEAYYSPMEARIAKLRPGAGAELTSVLDAAAAETAAWRAVRSETGYLQVVAVPS